MIEFCGKIELFFYELVQRAQLHTKTTLSPNTEFSVVFLLSDIHHNRIDEMSGPLFFKLENAIGSSKDEQFKKFKNLGDSSLAMLGFFSENIQQKALSQDYFRSMGCMGYSRASEVAKKHFVDRDFADFYEEMADCFVDAEVVIRKVKGLVALRHIELR